MNYQNISEVPLCEKIGRKVAVTGHLLAKGTLMDGGNCWLAPNRDAAADTSLWVALGPNVLFGVLLEKLGLRAGSQFVLSEQVRVEGVIQKNEGQADAMIEVVSLIAETQLGEIQVNEISVEGVRDS